MTVIVLTVAGLLLLLGGWVRAAGTAITGVPRADALRDASDDVKGAAVIADLLDERDTIAPAVGVVASTSVVISAVLIAVIAASGQSVGRAAVSALIVAFVTVIVGDLVPRAIGRASSARVAFRSSAILSLAVSLGRRVNDLFPEPESDDDEDAVDLDDDVEEHERELIDSVLEFTETIVREVMTPRPDMVTIPVTAPIEELIEVASEAGFSRVPVSSDGDIVGLVIVKDLLSVLTDEQRPSTVAEVMRPIGFMPETKLAAALLGEMQENHFHQVIVVDEYGDVAGLVTIEDLLEELVGEIADETDFEESLIVSTGDGWDVDARLSVDDLIELTGVDLPDEEWDTVGGLVLGLAERVPVEGEEFEFQQLRLKVSKMQGRRVSEVSVTRSQIEAV